MINQKIADYLKEGKKRGIGIVLLKQKLLGAGWNEKDIDDSIYFMDSDNKQAPRLMEQPTMPHEKLGLFSKIGKAIAHPTELFERTKDEGIGPALAYLLVLSIIHFVMGFLIFILFSSLMLSLLGPLISILPQSFLYIALSLFVFDFIIIPITSFVGAGILHLFIKIYKGRGGYSDTFRAQIYSTTPILLFGFIPFVNFAAVIWNFVLIIFGLSINHEISKLRAFLALLTPVILVIILVVLVWLFVGPSLILT